MQYGVMQCVYLLHIRNLAFLSFDAPRNSNFQRGWFGTDVHISFTVIQGKSASVHALTCLPWGTHLLSVSLVAV